MQAVETALIVFIVIIVIAVILALMFGGADTVKNLLAGIRSVLRVV